MTVYIVKQHRGTYEPEEEIVAVFSLEALAEAYKEHLLNHESVYEPISWTIEPWEVDETEKLAKLRNVAGPTASEAKRIEVERYLNEALESGEFVLTIRNGETIIVTKNEVLEP